MVESRRGREDEEEEDDDDHTADDVRVESLNATILQSTKP